MAGAARDGGRRVDARVRQLEAEQQDVLLQRHAREAGLRVDVLVGARGDGDLVLALRVDDDERHARGLAPERDDADRVDVLAAQVVDGGAPEVVVADRAHERDVRTGARRGHRLVGALPAGVTGVAAAGHRLARAGQPGGGDDQVDVDGADDEDASGAGHGG